MIHSRVSSRAISFLALLSALLLTTACPRYSIVARDYYYARSTFGGDMYQLVIYDGIYANGKEGKKGENPIALAIEDLETDIVSGDNFNLLPPLFSGSLREIQSELEQAKKEKSGEQATGKNGKGKSGKTIHPAVLAYDQYVLEHLESRFGGFYTHPRTGRLCAWQIFRLTGVRRFVPIANANFSVFAEKNILGDLQEGKSDERMQEFRASLPKTIKLWRNLCASREGKWFALEGSAVKFQVPGAPEEAAALRAKFWENVVPALVDTKTTATWPATAASYGQTAFSMTQNSGGMRFTLGDPDRKINAFIASAGITTETLAAYEDNLTIPAQARYHDNPTTPSLNLWRGTVDPASLAVEFERSPAAMFQKLPARRPLKDDNVVIRK